MDREVTVPFPIMHLQSTIQIHRQCNNNNKIYKNVNGYSHCLLLYSTSAYRHEIYIYKSNNRTQCGQLQQLFPAAAYLPASPGVCAVSDPASVLWPYLHLRASPFSTPQLPLTRLHAAKGSARGWLAAASGPWNGSLGRHGNGDGAVPARDFPHRCANWENGV